MTSALSAACPYVEFERQGIAPAIPIAAPVLSGERYGGKPIYFSDVIVRRGSPFQRFADLRGHTWCYNEPLSHSGYGITRYHLLQLGETQGFFRQVVEAGYHETSLRWVLEGTIDGSAIDSQMRRPSRSSGLSRRATARTIEALGPSTIQPVAVSKRLAVDLREQIREVLLTLHEDPMVQQQLAIGLVDHFTSVGPEDYDDIRRMRDACAAAGFMTIT
jgi:phosphonate transport system substrate-binding protein